jgi:hypothetical protein
MTNFKKILTSILVVTFLMATPIFQAYAANTGNEISPRMTYISSSNVDLYINNNEALICASVTGYTSVTKCELNVVLQEYNSGDWDDHKIWNKSYNSRRCYFEESTTNITLGNSYRAVITITAWSGSKSETQTIITDTYIYN